MSTDYLMTRMGIAMQQKRFHSNRSRSAREDPAKGVVLYLTNQSPYPPRSGGQMREWQLLSRLERSYDIDLLVVTPYFSRDVSYCDTLLECCRSITLFEAEPDSISSASVPGRIAQHACTAARDHVRAIIESSPLDLIHIEGYFMMQHLPVDCAVPIFLVEENIEYDLDRARDRVLGSAAVDWTVTRDLEHDAWRRALRCGTVSQDDAATMHADMPGIRVDWLPNGCDHFSPDDAGDLPVAASSGPRVVYTGNTHWGPSEDATRFLVRDVWPLVQVQRPDAVLDIAGDGPEATHFGLAESDTSVRFLGPLQSFGPLLNAADVFVCPPRYGGGVKSKILESLHAGCAVVSTPVGLQGLPSAVCEAVISGDTSEELAKAIVALLGDRQLAERLRASARRARTALPTWYDAVRRLDLVWSEIVAAGIAERTRSTTQTEDRFEDFEPVRQ
jgi:polysaccharide biosynthesis protein PslH